MTSNNDKLSRKKQVVELPKNTNVSIAEALNEDDSEGDTPQKTGADEEDETEEQQKKKASTPQDLALEVLNEIIDIVLEAEREANTLESSEIVSNALLQ